MQPVRPASHYLWGLSRRGFRWNSNTGLAAALPAPGLVGPAIEKSRGPANRGWTCKAPLRQAAAMLPGSFSRN